jgi:hypothetical protein
MAEVVVVSIARGSVMEAEMVYRNESRKQGTSRFICLLSEGLWLKSSALDPGALSPGQCSTSSYSQHGQEKPCTGENETWLHLQRDSC